MLMFTTSPPPSMYTCTHTFQAWFTAFQQHPDLADREGPHHTVEQALLCSPQSCAGEVSPDYVDLSALPNAYQLLASWCSVPMYACISPVSSHCRCERDFSTILSVEDVDDLNNLTAAYKVVIVASCGLCAFRCLWFYCPPCPSAVIL